ncbi:MAG TPA: hypothetical protein VLJ62_02150, partial [Burkholderiaceae bacterium]|nr:hypothetical protein [Burkholderiaceae bacterium]
MAAAVGDIERTGATALCAVIVATLTCLRQMSRCRNHSRRAKRAGRLAALMRRPPESAGVRQALALAQASA